MGNFNCDNCSHCGKKVDSVSNKKIINHGRIYDFKLCNECDVLFNTLMKIGNDNGIDLEKSIHEKFFKYSYYNEILKKGDS